MAAGLGFKTFTTGEVLTAGDVNGYLMQGILVFASEAARDASITSPQEGQFAFTKDNNSLWYYTGSAWAASGATGDIEGVTAGVGISGGGTSGTVTITNSMATAIDAKGDLVPGTGADTFARLAVGADNTVLTADSSTATGLKWASPAGGGGLTLIQEQVASANTGIDFTSISGSYKQLVLIWSGVYHSSTGGGFGIRFNSSSASNYIDSGLYVDNSTAGTEWSNNTFCGDDAFGLRASNTSPANASQGWLQIDNYASTTRVKPFLLRFSYYDSTSAAKRAYDYSGFFNDTTAITSINIVRRSGSDTITNLSNTSIRLYGLS